jgi:hypothetical protein
VHLVSEEPVTLHVNAWDAPVAIAAVLGATPTATGGGAAVTVMVAVSVFVGSAWLVATR